MHGVNKVHLSFSYLFDRCSLMCPLKVIEHANSRCAQLGEELWFTVGGQHIPFGASPQVLRLSFDYFMVFYILCWAFDFHLCVYSRLKIDLKFLEFCHLLQFGYYDQQ